MSTYSNSWVSSFVRWYNDWVGTWSSAGIVRWILFLLYCIHAIIDQLRSTKPAWDVKMTSFSPRITPNPTRKAKPTKNSNNLQVDCVRIVLRTGLRAKGWRLLWGRSPSIYQLAIPVWEGVGMEEARGLFPGCGLGPVPWNKVYRHAWIVKAKTIYPTLDI